jgi:hypothetical protein
MLRRRRARHAYKLNVRKLRDTTYVTTATEHTLPDCVGMHEFEATADRTSAAYDSEGAWIGHQSSARPCVAPNPTKREQAEKVTVVSAASPSINRIIICEGPAFEAMPALRAFYALTDGLAVVPATADDEQKRRFLDDSRSWLVA